MKRNSYLFESGENLDSILDGFTLTNGKASSDGGGGGIRCVDHSSPTIRNCIITHNSSLTNGGGIICVYSSPYIHNNKISHNDAGAGNGHGGGIYSTFSSPLIIHNEIRENSAYIGAGVCCASYASVYIEENTIIKNIAEDGAGGAIGCVSDESSLIIANTVGENEAKLGGALFCKKTSPLIANNLIYDNSATQMGGGLFADTSNFIMLNNTIYGNMIDPSSSNLTPGGGIFLYGNCKPVIMNTILWANNDDIANAESDMISFCNISDRDFKGINGNISQDCRFVNIAGSDFHLLSGSPCINAGGSDMLFSLGKDRNGRSRIQGGSIDIGAFESEYGTAHTEPLSSAGGFISGTFVSSTSGSSSFLSSSSFLTSSSSSFFSSSSASSFLSKGSTSGAVLTGGAFPSSTSGSSSFFSSSSSSFFDRGSTTGVSGVSTTLFTPAASSSPTSSSFFNKGTTEIKGFTGTAITPSASSSSWFGSGGASSAKTTTSPPFSSSSSLGMGVGISTGSLFPFGNESSDKSDPFTKW